VSLRLPIATLLALGVSASLFYLMSVIIAADGAAPGEVLVARPIEIVRVERESELRTKQRRLPQRATPARPPPVPRARRDPLPRPQLGDPEIGVVSLSVTDLAAPSAGTALSDMDVVPLVRVPPEYPRRAAKLGIGGWVLLEFTVTSAGAVTDIEVLDSDPPDTFDRAAVRAVERFKYRPKVERGRPVERSGVRIVIDFEPKAQAS